MKLVFIHGAGSSGLAYHYQLQHFSDSTALDLPGRPHQKPCSSIEGYLEWVRGFIAANRYEEVVLCGHSMGGAITLLYALLYPDELRGIILVGTGARLRVHPDYLQLCREPGENNTQWLAGQMGYYTGVEPELVEVLKARSAEIGPEVELNDLLACDRFDVMQHLQDIRLPALVICGAEDTMTPVRYADYLSNQIPGAQETIIPQATHFVQLQQYQQVNASIERFLETLK